MKIGRYYILNDKKEAVPADLMEWGRFFENSENRIVAKTAIGNSEISTVFPGLDHSFSGDGPPLLYETMIFGGMHDEYQRRCSTWVEAEAMHEKAVNLVRGTQGARIIDLE